MLTFRRQYGKPWSFTGEEVESLSSRLERLEWRNKVLELSSQRHSQPEIARLLQIGLGSVNRDLICIRQRANQNIRKYIDERLPEEYEKCLVGLNSIVKEAWSTSQQTQNRREKIQALSLAKDCPTSKNIKDAMLRIPGSYNSKCVVGNNRIADSCQR